MVEWGVAADTRVQGDVMPNRPNRPEGDHSPQIPQIPDRGCEYHRPSCFSCPFRDCVLAMSQVERQRELVRVSDLGTMARFNQLSPGAWTPPEGPRESRPSTA